MWLNSGNNNHEAASQQRQRACFLHILRDSSLGEDRRGSHIINSCSDYCACVRNTKKRDNERLHWTLKNVLESICKTIVITFPLHLYTQISSTIQINLKDDVTRFRRKCRFRYVK